MILFDKDGNIKEPKPPKAKGFCAWRFGYVYELCDVYSADTGPGILMKDCTNCFYFEDRRFKYRKLDNE